MKRRQYLALAGATLGTGCLGSLGDTGPPTQPSGVKIGRDAPNGDGELTLPEWREYDTTEFGYEFLDFRRGGGGALHIGWVIGSTDHPEIESGPGELTQLAFGYARYIAGGGGALAPCWVFGADQFHDYQTRWHIERQWAERYNEGAVEDVDYGTRVLQTGTELEAE